MIFEYRFVVDTKQKALTYVRANPFKTLYAVSGDDEVRTRSLRRDRATI